MRLVHSALPLLRRTPPRCVISATIPDGILWTFRGGASAGTEVAAARLVGWVLTSAAVTLYVPMIAQLVRNKKTPESLSLATWSLQLLGFSITTVYHMRMGYPLSTFADLMSLGVQSAVILFLGMFYRQRVSAVAAVPVFGLLAAICAPMSGLKTLQAASAVVTTWALLPQIVANFRSRARGGFSPMAAGLSVIGNAGRLFTTMKLADGNLMLLVQFSACLVLNFLLLVQSLIWDD